MSRDSSPRGWQAGQRPWDGTVKDQTVEYVWGGFRISVLFHWSTSFPSMLLVLSHLFCSVAWSQVLLNLLLCSYCTKLLLLFWVSSGSLWILGLFCAFSLDDTGILFFTFRALNFFYLFTLTEFSDCIFTTCYRKDYFFYFRYHLSPPQHRFLYEQSLFSD